MSKQFEQLWIQLNKHLYTYITFYAMFSFFWPTLYIYTSWYYPWDIRNDNLIHLNNDIDNYVLIYLFIIATTGGFHNGVFLGATPLTSLETY